MKVLIKGRSVEDLQVTFFITDAKEKAAFHDRVAINICQGPHTFLAKCHSPQNYPEGEYEIPIKGAYVDGIHPTMPADLEKQYAESLGQMAQLCDVVCPYVLDLASVAAAEVPKEVKQAADEIMDYVDAVRP